ncbi:E3 ubiquitin-protein ligase TRIM37-like [Topomyia yanbarensis]|uniref:E3 ubiquitin-protein ligase TRIM37-like n=1 Tax=Topomyia yanbarensis TaxID=2498891 RepID=UPI00273CE912|nr:E3 ubiquitin-protein ligase TRIM37-like [Topomyia yanbarensis]
MHSADTRVFLALAEKLEKVLFVSCFYRCGNCEMIDESSDFEDSADCSESSESSEESCGNQEMVASRTKQVLCELHEQELKLFCLSCAKLICADCFLVDGAHMRHMIDYVPKVYDEKQMKLQEKFVILEDHVQRLQQDVAKSEQNLKFIHDAEQTVIQEIEALCLKAKLSVSRLTAKRKQTLQMYAEVATNMQTLNKIIQEKAKHLRMEEFIEQERSVHQQCDEFIAGCVEHRFSPAQFEDIGCDLLPPYEMRTYTLRNFDKTTDWHFRMRLSCDILWNVSLSKTNDFSVLGIPSDNEMNNFSFKLLVVIVHDDMRKTIQKSFLLDGDLKEEKIATVSLLTSEGFVNKDNELVVKIGLRPQNVLVENQILKSLNAVQSKFCVTYFNLELSAATNKKSDSTLLVDRANRNWCLRVLPFKLSAPNSKLGLFIILLTQTAAKCLFFIELMHDDPKKNVRRCGVSTFEQIDSAFGYKDFLDRTILINEPGFYTNGVMRLRFGVQPLDNWNYRIDSKIDCCDNEIGEAES